MVVPALYAKRNTATASARSSMCHFYLTTRCFRADERRVCMKNETRWKQQCFVPSCATRWTEFRQRILVGDFAFFLSRLKS